MTVKTIKYMPSTVGRDPKNPLVDIHKDDETWYFNTLVEMIDMLSDTGQYKAGDEEGEYIWTQLNKRRPKTLSMGRKGPNSVVTLIQGLLANYIKNTAKYGVCRISKSQLEDFEYACQLFVVLDSERFEKVQFQQALFSQDGVNF